MLAITDWQSVGGYLGEIMASPGSSVMSFSACRTEPGASGYDFLLDICEFPRQYIGYRIGSIGRGCVTTFVLTWHHVLFVWHISFHAHGGLPWDMSMWGTVGIG